MSAAAKKPEDRRIQRTRRVLRESLISLILENGWEGVTVQDICDRADVGRSTFYTHYVDKEDLLVGGLEDLGKSLRAHFKEVGGPELLGFTGGLMEHVYEQKRLFRAIMDKRGGQVVQQEFRKQMVELVRDDLSVRLASGPGLELSLHFVAGALLEVITWWLDSREPLQPAQVERMFLQMARPAIHALNRQNAEKG